MATANLSVESKDFTLPVVEATAGADGIVVSTLRNDGWVTLDPGFLTTAQCESKISWTMQAIADELIRLEVVDYITDSTVCEVMKKTKSSRGS